MVPLAQNPFRALIGPLHGGKKVMFPIPKHDQGMVAYFKNLIESGEFVAVIDRTYPLDQIVDAYRYVETGQKTGNVVISLEGRSNRPSFFGSPHALTADTDDELHAYAASFGLTRVALEPAGPPRT